MLVEENVVVQVDPVTHHSYLWIDDEVVHRGGEDGLGRAFIAWDENPYMDMWPSDSPPVSLTFQDVGPGVMK